ncbi:hypothetical protein C8Q76DRAFT_207199 [Earliella scabrosa]|nr:hypothetical protein C8Q76DRAFT_207199 [Earliella scabrosa]
MCVRWPCTIPGVQASTHGRSPSPARPNTSPVETCTWKSLFTRDKFVQAQQADPALTLSSILQPLSTVNFIELSTLTLDLGSAPVTDRDVCKLASGLPALVHLQLAFKLQASWPSAHALVGLAIGCPALRVLDFGGMRVAETDFAEVETYPFCDHQLSVFHVRVARYELDRVCAMVLDKIFPHLDVEASRRRFRDVHPQFYVPGHSESRARSCWSYVTSSSDEERWWKVLDRLDAFHQAREEV